MRKIFVLSSVALLALGLRTADAAQPESPVACNEGNEPVALRYGDHTTGCEFETVTDRDRFRFIGAAGDNVRINVSSCSGMARPTRRGSRPERRGHC